MKLVLSVSVMIALFSSVSAKPSEAKLNCFIKHLKTTNKLESGFPLLGSGSVAEGCEKIVEAHQKIFYSTLLGITSNYEPEVSDCIMDAAMAHNLAGDVYKAQHYDYLKNVNQISINEKHQLMEGIERTLRDALKFCELENSDYRNFISDPQSFLDAHESVRELDFCMRKTFMEKHLAAGKPENFDENPFKLNIANINCEEIVEEFTCKKQKACRKYRKASSCLTVTKDETENLERFGFLAVSVQLVKDRSTMQSAIDRYFTESHKFEESRFICSFVSNIFYTLAF